MKIKTFLDNYLIKRIEKKNNLSFFINKTNVIINFNIHLNYSNDN